MTGLQYISDGNKVYNYIASIFPFLSGKHNYHNTFIYIREKNDYSPIEFEELAKINLFCENRDVAEYQLFSWKGINIAPLVCYELTDITARALFKGRCDFITASVFNPDTTYFSNIIDSTARDLHSFVVQANTSFYGDSRVTGPYDRDSKDIFKLKGGENDHVVIGTVNFQKYRKFQENYYTNLDQRVSLIKKINKSRKKKYPEKDRTKPNIKPLSARYTLKKDND